MYSQVADLPSNPSILVPAPDLSLAVHYAPRPDCNNWVNVLCEGQAEAKAICAYLSPIDAMIGAVLSSKPGVRFEVIDARQFDPTVFITDHNGRLAFAVHIGWPARDGQFIARPNGKPVSCAMYLDVQVPLDQSSHIAFTLQKNTFAVLECLYQSAGVFDYQKSFAVARDWPRVRLDRIVAKGIMTMFSLAPSGTEHNQVAIFDPFAEQWHFVSSEPLDSL